MGEFVGIDPRGALDLIRRMEAGEALLGRTRPRLDAAIDEAGQDWAGHQGATALHRALGFLHESRRDLKWRIDTIEQLVPVRERGMLTATFPFAGEPEAERAAGEAAASLRAALDDASTEGRQPELDDTAGSDPAYAAALLTGLGSDAFVRLMESGPPAHRTLLATAFASAERTGRLGEEWDRALESAPSAVLTALAAQDGRSGPLLNRIALILLNRADDPDWSPHDLIGAYDGNPVALQQLLAEHPRETQTLLNAAAGDPALAGALHEALKPEVGADGLRQRAWANVLRGVGAALRVEDG